MENNERDRKLDQWLDEALSQYSAAEPRLGLEQRVLANLRAEERAKGHKGWWRWMPAFAAIAAVLIVMVAVRPYWEEKGSMRTMSSPTPTKSEAADRDQATKEKPEEPVDAASKRNFGKAEKAPRAKRETVAPSIQGNLSKDSNLDDRQEAEIQPKMGAVPASRAFRNADDASADKKHATKESDAFAANESKQLVPGKTYDSLIVATVPAAPPAAKPDSGRTEIFNAPPAMKVSRNVQATPQPVASQAETVEVQGAAPTTRDLQLAQPTSAPPASIAGGIVGAGKNTLANTAANVKTETGKQNGTLAKKAKTPLRGDDAFGMALVKTELKRVPPGPTQQFPTPAPLSDEEKKMLAAGKQLTGKPADEVTGQKSDGDTKPIEIKNIEIAPLPGPPK